MLKSVNTRAAEGVREIRQQMQESMEGGGGGGGGGL